jgi:biopolymer transport protein ExbD
MNFLGEPESGRVSMYKKFIHEKNVEADINITSLIDVIFMLVVFFMIGASFEKPAIGLSLPKAQAGELSEKSLVVVSVDSGGTVYVDGKQTAVDALPELIASGGAAAVALECDGAVPFDTVVLVLDGVKKGGAQNVAIRHDPQ